MGFKIFPSGHAESLIPNSIVYTLLLRIKMASQSGNDRESYNRVFILGTKECSEETLHDFFSKFGIVKDVYFVTDRFTGERKGGFGRRYSYHH